MRTKWRCSSKNWLLASASLVLYWLVCVSGCVGARCWHRDAVMTWSVPPSHDAMTDHATQIDAQQSKVASMTHAMVETEHGWKERARVSAGRTALHECSLPTAQPPALHRACVPAAHHAECSSTGARQGCTRCGLTGAGALWCLLLWCEALTSTGTHLTERHVAAGTNRTAG